MKRLTGILLPALAITISSTSQADVNMKDAGFTAKIVDFTIGKFHFERSYNSRSLHQGLFGFGWCTKYEKSLSFIEGKTFLRDCELDNLLEVQAVKKKKTWIVENHQEIQTYNLQGQLISLQNSHRRKESLHYSSEGQLEIIAVSPRLQFRLTPHSSGAFIAKVERLKGPSPQSWEFKYEKGDWIQSGANRAKYDDYHNLIELKVNTHTTVITYLSDKDEVQSVSLGSCRETYEFTKGESLQLSKRDRFCDGKLTLSRSYAFEFTKNPMGQNILSRLRIYDPQSKKWQLDATFQPTTGRNALGDISELEPLR
jgi:hypothetical protein